MKQWVVVGSLCEMGETRGLLQVPYMKQVKWQVVCMKWVMWWMGAGSVHETGDIVDWGRFPV